MIILKFKYPAELRMVNTEHPAVDGRAQPMWARLVRPWSSAEHSVRVSLPSYTAMLKHKLRKSRKNILSLLEFHEEDEKRGNIPEYSEIKKTGRKDKKKKGRYQTYRSNEVRAVLRISTSRTPNNSQFKSQFSS